jgi:hypothetical protein
MQKTTVPAADATGTSAREFLIPFYGDLFG